MNVLMVCLGNICRSPMAEYLLRDAASKKGMTLRVESAGINAEVGNPATREARQVMEERGIDAEAHVARQLTEEMLRSADLVLVATENIMRRVLMYPDADVPVIPLSLQSQAGTDFAYRLGQALAPLVDKGFLVIGSGNITHNLRDYMIARQNGGQTPGYVRDFPAWMHAQLQSNDTDALLRYREQAPGAVQAHPSDEHLLPLYVALGAAGKGAAVHRFHAGISDYVLAMDAYLFTPVH